MNTKTFRILFILLMGLFLLPFSAQAGEDRFIELTVVKNDYLFDICKKYLDNPSKWMEIGRINRLGNYNLIHPGQRLVIPVRLLKGVPVDGRVLFTKGDVSVRATERDSWKALLANDRVRQGNLIRTGHESAVEIAFDDGTTFYQRPDTTLKLNVAERKGDVYFIHRLLLQTGRMIMKIRRDTGKEGRVEIQTPSATASARGTEFRASVDAKEAMTSEVLNGMIDVKAMRQVVMVNEGEGTLVHKGAPPLKPRKLLPPPLPLEVQPLYRTMPFSLNFGRVEGAHAYRFLLSKDPEGKDVIREKVIGVSETLKVTDLDDGIYYLHGRSIDEIGLEGLPLAPRKISVRINPLPPFVQAPADGARHKGKSVSFQWMKVRDAARYQIQISPDKEFRDAPENLVDTKEVSYDRAFRDFGPYYFRIRSIAPDDYEGLWSDILAFTLIPPPPSPTMEKPDIDEKELRFRWRSQGDKMSYHCQIARDENFSDLTFDRKVDRPEISLPKPEEPGVYYVRTSTIDPEGYEGGFSPPQSFEIKRNWTVAYIFGLGMVLLLILP